MLTELIKKNANLAKEKLKEEIRKQKDHIQEKEYDFYRSLITTPERFGIREQATYISRCKMTLTELTNALETLEKEFPTRNLDREFDLYGEITEQMEGPLDR